MNNVHNDHNLSDYINALTTFTAQLTPTGNIERINKSAAKSSGFLVESLIGKAFKDCHWWNFSHESQDNLAQDIKECAMGKRIDREAKVQIIDGQFIYMRLILTPVINAEGEVIYIMAEGQEITENNNLNNLNDYINALTTLTVQVTPTGYVKFVNKAAAEATGLSVDSFIGKAFKDCYWWSFSRESQDDLAQDIKECAMGKLIDREVSVRVINGDFIHVRFILTPIKNAAGQVIYLVAEGQDITEHTQDLNNLSDYINALTTFTAQLTPAGDIKLVNKAAVESTGLPLENFIGKAFKDCYWWNFSRESQDNLTQDIKECAMGKRINREVTARVAGGQFIHVRFILTPIKNAAGQITYLMAESQDITQHTQDLGNLSDYINALVTFTAQLSPSGHVGLVNKSAAEATGFPIESFIGKAFKDCYWWNFSRESQANLAQDIKECAMGKRVDRETEIQIAGGEFISIQFILTPITDSAGKVTYLVAEGQNITQRKRLELSLIKEKEVAENLASHDVLTGLPNRRYFMKYAEDKLSLAQRKGNKLALLYIDLDGFKAINDNISHQAGDKVLTTLGEKITNFVRKGEMVARLGGDEFAMLIYDYKNTDELEFAAKRLIEICTQLIDIEGITIKVGMSIGISTYPEHALNIDDLMSSADEAMYKVKRTIKGNYTFAD